MQTREQKIAHAYKVFAEHRAELKDLGGIQILDWRVPGEVWYRVRYVFDREGGRIYISGDLGEAVVWPTWPATFDAAHAERMATATDGRPPTLKASQHNQE